MKVKSSAPGKLMLLGEYAVVYGYPCIATAVDKRLYVEVEKVKCKDEKFITPQVKECRFVIESVKLFKEKFKIKDCLKIITHGDFSHQVGLGSSSAVTVAVIKALAELFKISLTNQEIFNLGHKVNLNIQGTGSGFDIAAAAFGKTIYFIRGGKKIELLNIDESLPLIIGYSGIKADTPEMVKNLEFKSQNLKLKFKEIFEEIGRLVDEAKEELINKNWKKLGELINKNQKLLQELGVSTFKLDKMCMAALSAGAYGAKLSGAGGGDCMIALVDPKKRKAVERAIIKVGGEIIEVKNSCEGVKIEK